MSSSPLCLEGVTPRVIVSRLDLSTLIEQQGDTCQSLWYKSNSNLAYRQYKMQIKNRFYLEQDISMYEWRMRQQGNILGVYHLEVTQDASKKKHLRVFLEKIQPLSQVCYLLSVQVGVGLITDCLSGFKTIFQKLGVVKITSKMIFIDEKKRGKIWINEAGQKNEFEFDFFGNQSSMIKNIWAIIEPKIEPHQLISKLREKLKSVRTFTQALNAVHKIIYETRYSRCNSTLSDRSERKYFTKTPQHFDITRTTKQIKNTHKQSASKSRQPSFKCLKPSQPTGLEFRQKEKNQQRTKRRGPLNLNKHNSLTPSLQNLDPSFNGLSSKNLSTKYLMFSSKTPKSSQNHLNYFTSKQISYIKNEKSRDHTPSRSSYSSKDFSFRSKSRNQDHSQSKPNNTLRPSNIFKSIHRKRTGSISHQSPQTRFGHLLQVNDSIKRSQQPNPIAKSMAVIKNQLQILKNLKFKDYTKESTKDFDHCSSDTLCEETLLSSRKYPKTLELHNLKKVQQSIISGEPMQESKSPNIIGQLKHSVFNRIDDLKQSQIIIEDNQEQSLKNSRASIAQENTEQTPLDFNATKHLHRIINKPMVQSITIKNMNSANIEAGRLPRSNQARFAKNEEQSHYQKSPFAHLWRFRSVKQQTAQDRNNC